MESMCGKSIFVPFAWEKKKITFVFPEAVATWERQ